MIEETIRLLKDECCSKHIGSIIQFVDSIYLCRVCDYENIVIYRPKGMEFTMEL